MQWKWDTVYVCVLIDHHALSVLSCGLWCWLEDAIIFTWTEAKNNSMLNCSSIYESTTKLVCISLIDWEGPAWEDTQIRHYRHNEAHFSAFSSHWPLSVYLWSTVLTSFPWKFCLESALKSWQTTCLWVFVYGVIKCMQACSSIIIASTAIVPGSVYVHSILINVRPGAVINAQYLASSAMSLIWPKCCLTPLTCSYVCTVYVSSYRIWLSSLLSGLLVGGSSILIRVCT